MLTNRRSRAWRSSGPLVIALALLTGCTADLPESSGECWTLARVPGPEDLVLVPEGDAVLVSSQDRRADPQPQGAIWYVPLESADPARHPRRLKLRGRGDQCSFHPHGIDLITLDPRPGEKEEAKKPLHLLYVINHHEPGDNGVTKGCFELPSKARPRAAVTSVEVFEYRGGEIFFLQRLADPAALTKGNDLVARSNGDLWVTSPPSNPVARLLDFQDWPRFWFESSKVVRFACDSPRETDGRCTGAWKEVELPFEEPLRYVNGIEIRESTDSPLLYLASTGGQRIHVARIGEVGELTDAGTLCVEGMPDNLAWDEDALLVAAHPYARRFTQHARSPGTPSPSKAYRLEPPNSAWSCHACVDHPRPERRSGLVFRDSGGRVSAASVAVRVGKDLVLGQVFEPAVVRCRTELERNAEKDGGVR